MARDRQDGRGQGQGPTGAAEDAGQHSPVKLKQSYEAFATGLTEELYKSLKDLLSFMAFAAGLTVELCESLDDLLSYIHGFCNWPDCTLYTQ
jgi:hypothetical protein